MMTNLRNEEPVRTFVQLWVEGLSMVLGQIATVPFPIEATEAAPDTVPAQGAGDLHITVTAGGGVRGEMSLRIAQASALELVRIFVGCAETPARDLILADRAAVEEPSRQLPCHVSSS